MEFFKSWPVIAMPSDPPAPASIEFTISDAVALSMSPFTGEQQIQNWGPLPKEASFSMPAMPQDQALLWIQWLRDLKGIEGVFEFDPKFVTAYPESAGFWRLKSNQRKWSVSEMRYYGMHLEIREAL